MGSYDGKPRLFGSGVVLPERQLHFNEIRKDSCKISMSTIVCPNDAKPFYENKHGENKLVAGQICEWPVTYLLSTNSINKHLNLNFRFSQTLTYTNAHYCFK